MTGGYRIALAQPGAFAADTLASVMADAFDLRFGEAWTAAQCRTTLLLPGARLWLAADRDDAVCGFALTLTVLDSSELLLIAVHPRAQRQGIGNALIEHWLGAAQMAKLSRLTLEVRDGNPAAELYRRHGFRRCGTRPRYYRSASGDSHDALTMVKML